MTIAQIKDNLQTDNWASEQERTANLSALVKTHFTPVSVQTIMNFQATWDGSRSFEEFKAEQAKVLLQCIEIEQHSIGEMVRESFNRGPLTDDTEV